MYVAYKELRAIVVEENRAASMKQLAPVEI
jgi:hypothetical protein